MTKNVKTPLSYAGGKSRFLKQLDQNTPNLENINNFYDLFLGGGSFAIHITKKYPHLNIYVNDINSKLINFWQVLQNQNDDLVKALIYIKNNYDRFFVKKLIKDLRNNEIENHFNQAVAYYLANKCSFAGTTESGGFSNYNYENKFNIKNIKKLTIINRHIQKWNITSVDYKNIDIKKNSFVYLDPPYNNKAKLYGKNGDLHKNFDFKEFVKFTKNLDEKVLISFNNNNLLDYYNSWIINKYDHTYLMQSNKKYLKNQEKRKEVVIKNYESRY